MLALNRVARRRAAPGPASTTPCGAGGPGGLCCEPDEECELLIPVLGENSPARCKKKCDPECTPPFDSCCPVETLGGDFVCVNTSENNNHCGGCNNVCPDGQKCKNSVCQCPEGAAACGDQCCSPGQSCVDGVCTDCNPPCPDGQTCCDSSCVDTQTDRNNCGTCGSVCPGNQTCANGVCTGCTTSDECPSGQSCCNNTCINTQSDPNNCGACGTVCPSGETCTNGQCSDTSTCDPACPPGQLCCGDPTTTPAKNYRCFDPMTSNENCGGCATGAGRTCRGAPSQIACISGVCTCIDGGTPCEYTIVRTPSTACCYEGVNICRGGDRGCVV